MEESLSHGQSSAAAFVGKTGEGWYSELVASALRNILTWPRALPEREDL